MFFRIKTKLEPLRSTQPIDVAAHLALLGESLGIIGQRLKEHQVIFILLLLYCYYFFIEVFNV